MGRRELEKEQWVRWLWSAMTGSQMKEETMSHRLQVVLWSQQQ